MSAAGGQLHPEHGARLLLERRSVDAAGESAAYRGSVLTPHARFDYAVTLRADGGVELTAEGTAAPADLEQKLVAHARQVARAAGRRRAEGMSPWPHRVLRWRDTGRGGGAAGGDP